MDHAEVRDHLQEAFLEPPRLRALDVDDPSVRAALRDHLHDCPACSAEYLALLETAALLTAAAPDSVTPSPLARQRVLGAVSQMGVARGVAPPRRGARRLSPLAGLAAAAAVVLLLGGTVLGVELLRQRDGNAQELRGLAAVTATTNRLMTRPDHEQAVLTAAEDGGAEDPAGMLLFDPRSGELVVVSHALQPPDGDRVYRCYLEDGGEPIPVGQMHFAQGLAYWAGPVEPHDGWAGMRFVVREDWGEQRAVLEADL